MYLLLAGLATPLVVSVHSIVSSDFATAVIPGWHTTIFPPYFVAGAIFSGMAMVLTLMLVARKVMHMENYITLRHIDPMCKLVLATSCLVGAAYATEVFIALYSGNPYEQFMMVNRMAGPYGWGYRIMVACNVLVPQLFWFPAVRRNLPLVFVITLLVNLGMWFERFVIIVTSLHRDFLPSSWTNYVPTSIETRHAAGQLRAVLHLLSVVLPRVAHDQHQRSQRRAAASSDRTLNRDRLMSQRVLLAAFRREEDLLSAVRAVRASGATIVDVYSPYAVHGLDEALGWRPSRLTWACALCGARWRLVHALVPVLDIGGQLAAERRRQAVQFAARVCAGDLRGHGAVRSGRHRVGVLSCFAAATRQTGQTRSVRR